MPLKKNLTSTNGVLERHDANVFKENYNHFMARAQLKISRIKESYNQISREQRDEHLWQV